MFAGLFARLGLWLAAFALLSQSLAISAAPAPPGDAHSAAAELSALLGPGVVVCAQSDQPDKPAHHAGDCDLCPLCRTVAGVFALDLPVVEPLATPAAIVAETLAVESPPLRLSLLRQSRPQARAPPVLT